MLWVEHDLAAVRRLADRVTALSRGRLLWTREPAALGDADMLLQLFAHTASYCRKLKNCRFRRPLPLRHPLPNKNP